MNINELPEWNESMGRLLTSEPIHHYYPEHVLNPVSYQSWHNPLRWYVGYVVDRAKYDAYQSNRWLSYRTKLREYRGGYEFRRGPVPGIHRYPNSVKPITSKGTRKEFSHNEICKAEFPELNLVRTKRNSYIKDYFWHDYDYEPSYNSIKRSWKRTKKRKQYQ